MSSSCTPVTDIY
ncbi:hypothetical protein E2C01_093134 [Portunus trituberculatus]|uniref:Uncharacterized protein n=1 Tax=Portunus trituberculatus TaxID=210409 RepID=A0A5B7JSH7_PORTR|nr:hypothetical protein [Portunus trituberculatus]